MESVGEGIMNGKERLGFGGVLPLLSLRRRLLINIVKGLKWEHSPPNLLLPWILLPFSTVGANFSVWMKWQLTFHIVCPLPVHPCSLGVGF